MSPLRRVFPCSGLARALFPLVWFSLAITLLLTIGFAERPLAFGPLFAQTQTRPLDPLTSEEAELAARIASADPNVKKELGSGRRQLIQVQFLALKEDSELKSRREPERSTPGRCAAVLFYRYDTDQGINVVVDLNERSVGDITRLEGRGVPLALEEVAQSFTVALLNKRVRDLLGPKANEFRVAGLSKGDPPQNRVEGLRVIATSQRDPCYRHRCIELHFRRPEGYVAALGVTVDLSAQTASIQSILR